jgi:hypothetical protein
MNRSSLQWGLASLMCLVGIGAAAEPAPVVCTLTAHGAAEVRVRGEAAPLPLSLADCRDAVVARGTVVACVADAEGLPRCRAFDSGQRVDAGSLAGGAGGALTALQRLLHAVPGQPAGQPRGAETLLPSKVVLLLDGRVLVDFSEADLQGVDTVEFRSGSADGPLAARIARAAGVASTADTVFAAGPDYWVVLVPAERPSQSPRRFSLAEAAERQATLDRLRVFDRLQAGPLATAMMRAAWLAQQNYGYDALATMKAVGLRAR